MAGSPGSRWSDDRLDDLNRRVLLLNGVGTTVAVLESKFEAVVREVHANTEVCKDVADQFEKVQLEPLKRARDLRDRVYIAVASACAGGGVAVLISVLSK